MFIPGQIWSNSAHIWQKMGICCRSRPNFVLSQPKFGRVRPIVGRKRQTMAPEFVPDLVDFVPHLAEIGHLLSRSAQICSKPTQIGSNAAHSWPKAASVGPEVWPNLVETTRIRSTSANVGRIGPTSGGRHRPNLALIWSKVVRIWPELGRLWPKSVQVCSALAPKVARTLPATRSGKVPPTVPTRCPKVAE